MDTDPDVFSSPIIPRRNRDKWVDKTCSQKQLSYACFGNTHDKTRIVQRRLAWPLCKDDRQIHETFH